MSTTPTSALTLSWYYYKQLFKHWLAVLRIFSNYPLLMFWWDWYQNWRTVINNHTTLHKLESFFLKTKDILYLYKISLWSNKLRRVHLFIHKIYFLTSINNNKSKEQIWGFLATKNIAPQRCVLIVLFRMRGGGKEGKFRIVTNTAAAPTMEHHSDITGHNHNVMSYFLLSYNTITCTSSLINVYSGFCAHFISISSLGICCALCTDWLGENVSSSLPTVHYHYVMLIIAVNPCGNCPKIGNLKNYLLGSHSKGFIIWSRKTTSNYIFLEVFIFHLMRYAWQNAQFFKYLNI